MRLKLIALATLAAGSLAFAQQITIAALMKTTANPFWGAMEAGVKEGAAKSNVNLILQSVASETDVEAQLNACLNLLQRKPQALIVAAINSVNLLPCLKQANAQNVPIVDLDGNLDPTVLQKENIKIAFSIGSDNRKAGGQGAEYMVSKLGKDFKGKVLVIEGLAGNVTGAARRDGFIETLKAMAPGAQIVATLPGDWDRLKAANITNDTLQRNPDLAAIYCANDTMALGAVEAVLAANKKVLVVGTDGNSDAVKSIQAGRLNASVAQLPYLEGSRAVETMLSFLKGSKVEGKIPVPTLVIDKDVLDKKSDPLLQYLK
ncbi:MAG: substrate-binding domain-containing protein [Thermaceae bacterium]|nr:substrate-binding domain-containing protein [Thermaceae bacterium]